MKPIHLYFFSLSLLFCAFGRAQAIQFADPNFKALLLLSIPNEQIGFSGYNNYYPNTPVVIDSNNNGEIEQSEALRIKGLNIRPSTTITNIYNLGGIEYLTNLQYLEIYNVDVVALNPTGLNNLEILNWFANRSPFYLTLSGFPKLFNFDYNGDVNTTGITGLSLSNLPLLKGLSITSSTLTNIDFSNLPSLEYIGCSDNSITSLNFSNNPNLNTFLGTTSVTTLDFMNNPLFERLYLSSNPNLTTIKIKNGRQQLYIDRWGYSIQCPTNNPNLNYICADANEIAGLRNYLSGSGITQPITIDSNCVLSNSQFDKSNFGLYPNPATNSFKLNADVTKVAIYSLTGQLVKQFSGAFDSNTNFGIESLNNGIYLVRIMDNDNNEKSLRLIKQ